MWRICQDARKFCQMDRVILIAFGGAQTLDIAGPAEVFSTASRQANAPLYEIVLASARGGPIRTTCGFELATLRLDRLHPRPRDTVIVSGGEETGVRAAIANRRLLDWVERAARTARRVGSVCSGAFVLAAAG